ncbi:regulator of chromosome condensation [Anaeramoeba flamelloides]|uniref:Regulator of chromosome condensation n=1 Tax=Anaeramoeba flamelloides TaxID=1746091 RepID=A0AAV8A361_9EUKA|nr:regulator of chromosome condensation [Anaeramoeba flamelloides]
MKKNIYFCTQNPILDLKNHQKYEWVAFEEIEKPLKIVCGGNMELLVFGENNMLRLFAEFQSVMVYNYHIQEKIIDIAASFSCFFILTSCGKVYFLGRGTGLTENPFPDVTTHTYDKPKHIDFFQKNNLFVESIAIGKDSCFYLCRGGKLYANGAADYGKFGFHSNLYIHSVPTLIHENIAKVFSSPFCSGFFYLNICNEFVACGVNTSNKLGYKKIKDNQYSFKFYSWKSEHIRDIQVGQKHTVIITPEGETWSSGFHTTNGHVKPTDTFEDVPALSKKKVVKIAVGPRKTLALTEDNELYGWGNLDGTLPTSSIQQELWQTPQLLEVPKLPFYGSIEITCGAYLSIIYNSFHKDALKIDLKHFLNNKQFTDIKIGTKQHPAHVEILRMRIGAFQKMQIDEIQKMFAKTKPQHAKTFLKWAYYDKIRDQEELKQVFETLDVSFPPENNLIDDLARLYDNESSKDFKLQIQVNQEDLDDDNDEDEYDEIPVHKSILLARSGIFRDMFNNVNEKEKDIKQIMDYTGKSIESLQVLIHFLYTDKLKLTADCDPDLVFEELDDVVEYYQLNEYSTLYYQIKELQSKLQNTD